LNKTTIIIIIIIPHELDLDKPVSASSDSLFKGVFVHVVYNSALLLATCYCSFLLHVAAILKLRVPCILYICCKYVVANLICIFLVYHKLVLLSILPKFLHSVVVKKGVPGSSYENFISMDENLVLSFFLRVKISLPHKRTGTASV